MNIFRLFKCTCNSNMLYEYALNDAGWCGIEYLMRYLLTSFIDRWHICYYIYVHAYVTYVWVHDVEFWTYYCRLGLTRDHFYYTITVMRRVSRIRWSLWAVWILKILSFASFLSGKGDDVTEHSPRRREKNRIVVQSEIKISKAFIENMQIIWISINYILIVLLTHIFIHNYLLTSLSQHPWHT